MLRDGPVGARDAKVRKELRDWLRRLHDEIPVTTVCVTHDQEEALTLSDRIAIINQGKLVQLGQPERVYEQQETVFAARFLGDANVFTGTVVAQGLQLATGEIVRSATGQSPTVIVRPEKMEVAAAGTPVAPGLNQITGQILQVVFSGASVTYRIKTAALGAEPLLVFAQNRAAAPLARGSAGTIAWAPQDTVAVSQ